MVPKESFLSGILYVRDGVNLEKQQHGAGHERGLRAGTESILLIVGLARALEMATNSELLKEHENNMRRTRDLCVELKTFNQKTIIV
jgi:cysteine desulfurase